MDLVEFLRARLGDDEKAALAWLPFGNPDDADRAHIACHDPARVLAEVEAKRLIIEAHPMGTIYAFIREGPYCNGDDEVWPCPTMRALALPYADHPEYDEAWRPQSTNLV